MCGIIGYIGGGNAAEIVYEGLLNLEYRGYDSAGMALRCGGKNAVFKKQGRVEKLLPLIAGIKSDIGIGHTRWATHGKPSDENAHPHTYGKIAVVHNGIIENYGILRGQFEKQGEKFTSSTDSEVIAHLISSYFTGNLLEAVAKAVKVLEGSYALIVMCEGVEEIIAARYKSPLIIGLGYGENFCASDEPALAGKCPEICVLEDNDIAVIGKSEVSIFDSSLRRVARQNMLNIALPAVFDLGNCPHYMLKELREVPASIKNTASAFFDIADSFKKVISGADRIIMLGCGTAYHAGLLGKRYIESFARIPVEAENAGEFRYKDPVITAGTVVFAVSQSGETADTLEAAKLAKSLGAKLVAVTNSPHSQLSRLADLVLPVVAGSEICVAATKSYTGQITALYLAALLLAGIEINGENTRNLGICAGQCKNLCENLNIETVAQMCAQCNGVYFIGRDLDYAVALEGSLKLKEVTYIAGEGYPAGELKHGTLALIDENTLTVVIITDEALAGKCANAVNEVVTRGGKAAVITNVAVAAEELKGQAEIILLPECEKYLSPLLSAVAVQMLAYRTAVILGRNPDKPRNLAKSVTVE